MATQNSQLRLSVTDSTARFLRQGGASRFVLASDKGAASIGSMPDSVVQLRSEFVSRRHAVIEHDGNNWKIRDLGSKAGTKVNQAAVSLTEYTTLQPGDEIQLGPVTLAVRGAEDAGESFGTSLLSKLRDEESSSRTFVAKDLGGAVSAIPEAELSGLAQYRLTVLLKSAASLTAATDITTLANAITKTAVNGTSSPRAVLIGTTPEDEWTVLGEFSVDKRGAGEIAISRSLVAMARQGEIAQLQLGYDDNFDQAASIMSLNIRSALCTPLVVDNSVAAVLYLDARNTEKPIKQDAAAFCLGLAQLGGMAIANLRRAELARREKEMRDELVAARVAQKQMLPESTGEVGPVRYSLEAVPGTIVAGDLFDIFPIDENSTLVVLGDVMGKGAAAGLMMMSVQTYFRARSNPQIDLPQLVAETNSYFHDRFKGKGFVTLWIGMFNALTRRLHYVDAGHGHWAVFQQNSGLRTPESQGGPPIGAFPNATYELGELEIPPGDRIILFSDGLVEQHNEQGQLFGEANEWSCMTTSPSAVDDVQLLLAAHGAFRGQVPLSDDLTIASIELISDRSEVNE